MTAIRTTASDGLRTVTIVRPEQRNAVRPADLTAIASAVQTTTEPVVYLRGAGDAFCAGADLDVVTDLDREAAEAFARHGQRVADALAGADAVVVAGIDGATRGGGVELALACDLRVATPEATFAETGVRLGLFGAWGGTARLPEVIGDADAMDLALSGRVVGADEARRMGLVSRVVTDPRDVAREVAANPADALRALKARLRDDASREAQYRREAEAFADLIVTHRDDIDREQDG